MDYQGWVQPSGQCFYQARSELRSLWKNCVRVRRLNKILLYDEGIDQALNTEAEVKDVNRKNIEELIKDIDIILDGTDNLETRFLINDASFKHNIPWIYGATISSYGMTMNIVPAATPCFRCIIPSLPAPGAIDTCDTVGALNAITSCIAPIQSNEAIKILLETKDSNLKLLAIDLMNNSFEKMAVKKRDASYLGFLLKFRVGKYELIIFPDGRAFIKGVSDKETARSL
ncbi:MAG: ThiF family adenylyltransferase [Dehalococcoidales bacterium]|nr:ThiF family adenylyltransferase [Dehalococcoidales bacterium]